MALLPGASVYSPGGRTPMAHVNRDYPLNDTTSTDLWSSHTQRQLAYSVFWRFYLGAQWAYEREVADPSTTINYCQKFIDKHTTYLMANSFSIHTNRKDFKNPTAEDLLNANWEANGLKLLNEMSTVGAVTGDCWVNVGYDVDPIFGERIKYTVLPSEVVIPVFNRTSSREPDAILLRWQDNEITSNVGYAAQARTRSVVRGAYWTKSQVWELENDVPVSEPKKNALGQLPFVHMANISNGTDYWGRSTMNNMVLLNRELNERFTDIGDIINYHAAPVTVIYGAHVSQLQKGVNRTWSGLSPTARIENLQLEGDLGAANEHLNNLKDTLFQLGDIPAVAFGSAGAISNTSAAALQLQFAPLLEHMKFRRTNYGEGIQKLNWLTLLFFQLMGQYKVPNQNPYYSYVKWPDPLPRDKALELQHLIQMHSVQLLGRAQMLRQLVQNDLAPADIDPGDVDKVVQQSMDEELKWTQAMTEATTPPPAEPTEPSGTPPPTPGKGSVNEAAAASRRTQQATIQ